MVKGLRSCNPKNMRKKNKIDVALDLFLHFSQKFGIKLMQENVNSDQ